MKTKVINFFKRLRIAWQIVRGRKYYYMLFSDRTTNERIYLLVAMDAARKYLELKTNSESCDARMDIIGHALNTDESILAQYKYGDECYVSYDCNFKEDLDELLNQEIEH